METFAVRVVHFHILIIPHRSVGIKGRKPVNSVSTSVMYWQNTMQCQIVVPVSSTGLSFYL
jgi:hypothetical protein